MMSQSTMSGCVGAQYPRLLPPTPFRLAQLLRLPHQKTREGHNGVQGLKAVVGGMTTVEGERGAITKRTEQIKKWTERWPATKVSMMGAVDNGVGRGQWSRKECNNQPSRGAVKVSSG